MPGLLDPTQAVTANPLLAAQVARARGILRPDVTDFMGYGPDWVSYWQNFRRNLAEQFKGLGTKENFMGPFGLGVMKTGRAAAKKPRYDPGSPQQLIPGLEPLSLEEAYARARRELLAAQEGMSFNDKNRGLRFAYDPDWAGSAPFSSTLQPGAWDVGYKEKRFTTSEGEELYRHQGKRPVAQVRGNRVFRRDLEGESTRTIPQGMRATGATAQAEVGAENFQQMMERLERLRAAETEAIARGEEAMLSQARGLNTRISRHRALLAEPGLNAEQTRTLNEELLAMLRQRPVEGAADFGPGRMLSPSPANVDGGLLSPLAWRDLFGRSDIPPADRLQPLIEQARIVRRLRGEPEVRTLRDVPRSDGDALIARMNERGAMEQGAAQMDRDAVEAFLRTARSNPRVFQFGAEPPPNVRGIEAMADHFGRQADERILVDFVGSSDEPYKIKTPKEHGSGEVMRDRFGDYIYKTHERGDVPVYDHRGDKFTKEVELPGPLPKGEEGPLVGEKPKPARGGEIVYDEYGDPQYAKSSGGEPVRDERGRRKYTKEENPDYRADDELTLQGERGGPLTVHDWGSGEVTVTSTEVGKQKGGPGALLYQTLLADASRSGYKIGSNSLTEQNALRLLSNALSNYGRMGVNPRDVSNTSSGLAPRARGFAKGPEIWRAEAEEVKKRMRAGGTDPGRVRFDGAEFSVDGQLVKPEEIAGKVGWRSGELNIGPKTIMRMAFFDWLRAAPVEAAETVAKNWGRLGPLLGIGMGAGVLAPFAPAQSD